MSYFFVTLRKLGRKDQHFYRPAFSSVATYHLVAAEQGNEIFGITVVPA